MKRTILHTSDSRGTTNSGWLHSRHTFSFGDYQDSQRIRFGTLRVLNDHIVAPGKGFGSHPHSNMEILSIPLEGDLEHKDSLNNTSVIRSGDIQIMSAGTGVFHSETNYNKDQSVKFLQIWIYPRHQQIEPRYEQKSYEPNKHLNQWLQIVSPSPNDTGVMIHQDAWIYRSKVDANTTISYNLQRPGSNGLYLFVISGNIEINELALNPRDGIGFIEYSTVEIKVLTSADILAIEVPMTI